MATAFAHDVPDTSPSLARASAKLAHVAAVGTAKIARTLDKPDDAALIAELREKGLAGPISADFLARYRQDREFMVLARKLDTIPDGEERFIRALKRVGIAPSDDPTDAKLVSAWHAWRIASKAIEDSGAGAPVQGDAPHWKAREAAEETIIRSVPTTSAGSVACLRLALGMSLDRWAYTALIEGDDTTLFARTDELGEDQRLLVNTLAVLMRPTVAEPAADRFDRLAEEYMAARLRLLAEGGSEPDGGPIAQAYEAAADAMDEAVPTSCEQFARKFVCLYEDGRPAPKMEQAVLAEARRLLGDTERGLAA